MARRQSFESGAGRAGPGEAFSSSMVDATAASAASREHAGDAAAEAGSAARDAVGAGVDAIRAGAEGTRLAAAALAGSARSAGRKASARVCDASSRASEALGAARDQTRHAVRENPVSALALAAGLGAIAALTAMLFMRHRS